MKRLSIIWHSATGGTAQMAAAAAEGARQEEGVATRLLRAGEAGAADVLDADGCIFAAPENLASVAGVMKDFFDRTYYDVLGRVEGRPYATLVCAGSDGQGAAAQIARIATGWRLRAVADPLIICTHAQTPEDISRRKIIPSADLQLCHDLGAAMAAGLAMGIY